MLRSKLKKRLAAAWGKAPDAHYFAGDMDLIRIYADYRAETEGDSFQLDDISWNDLDIDRVFRRLNPRRSTSGEQYLYYMLRSPALDRDEWDARKQLIDLAAADTKRRLRMELILAKLGCTRRACGPLPRLCTGPAGDRASAALSCPAAAPARRGVGCAPGLLPLPAAGGGFPVSQFLRP